jgi:heme exporter protein C
MKTPWALLLIWLFMAVIIVAAYQAPPAEGFSKPEAARIIFFHVPAAISCIVFFGIGAWYAIRVLRLKLPLDDIKSVAALEMGTLMCVLATVTGSIFAYMQWNTPWNWDPRQTTIVAQLLIYAAYFALRGSIPDDRRRMVLSAGYAVFAMATVPFLMIVIPRVFATLHPNNTLISSAGLDPTYKKIFWSAFVGYMAIGLAIMRVRIQAGHLLYRLETERGLEDSGHIAATHRIYGADDLPLVDPAAGVAGSEGHRTG